MKIVLNVSCLKYPFTGIAWYTYYLLKGLQLHKAITQFIAIPSVSFKQKDRQINKNFFPLSMKKIIRNFPLVYIFSHNYRNYLFSKKTHFFSEKNFLYHEPCYILRPYSGLKIFNLHDLSHIRYPEYHPRERVKFLLRYLPDSIDNAQHIITSSYAMRDEIINFFKVSPNKITTIYHGVAPIFRERRQDEINPLLARYGLLNKSYLLSVGTLEPRKNLERLIQAFSCLSEKQRKRYPLVLVGMKGWGTGRLEKLIDKLARKGELICLAYVSYADLPFLYSGASGFVYLSLYEGFGLPILESLASGIPTLTSNISSMPEIVETAAVLVNPWDVDAISARLSQLLTDNSLRDDLKSKGPVRAAQFTWQKCVDNTVSVYQHLFASYS